MQYIYSAPEIYRTGQAFIDALSGYWHNKAVSNIIPDENVDNNKLINDIKDLKNKFTRKATDQDVQLIQKLYKKYNAGQGRNVAFAKSKINGETIELESVSGKINSSNPTQKGNFIPPNKNYYTSSNERLYDSEQKIIEAIREIYKGLPDVIGEVEIISQRPICIGCHSVINQFMRDFPNVKITVIEILTE